MASGRVGIPACSRWSVHLVALFGCRRDVSSSASDTPYRSRRLRAVTLSTVPSVSEVVISWDVSYMFARRILEAYYYDSSMT
jgi:hypothetical protein